MSQNIDALSINAIRFLSADAIQKAKSGHPGLPLGCADIGYELWTNHLRHNPKDPNWANRDRFVLSGGHGSMLLYSLLHLFGYEGIDIEAIKDFRQLNALTPGHPEYGHTVGVEATTGPLGQGMSMAVGMAMAEKHLAAIFNREDYPIVDHYTYVLGGDGCMMEGISSEAFSLAGDLGLNKLIVLYDANKICIEGSIDGVFSENVSERMEAFGFQTIRVANGNDIAEVEEAIEKAKRDTDRPSFIMLRTEIGYGCPNKEGTSSAHGEPLGDDNISAMRDKLDWPYAPFEIPNEVYTNYQEKAARWASIEEEWQELFADYCNKFPDLKDKWEAYHNGYDLTNLFESESYWELPEKAEATRSSSGVILNKLADAMPNLIGGSADLAPSNKTYMKNAGDFTEISPEGRNIRFGVREQAMAGITNGIALHGGLSAFAATFFVFSDYVKPMVRLSALMKLPVNYIFTHDSIGVGEDGPTHEPIEQLAQFRSMPDITVFRPCDRRETAAAWKYAMEKKDGPVAFVLTRQNLEQQVSSSKDISKGAYIISDSKADPELILIGTGSEVDLCMKAKEELVKDGVDVRVISMPSMDLFERQDDAYKESILPKACRKRVSVEAGSSFGWARYTGIDGANVSIDTFGASAPASQLFEKFGFTVENVVKTAKEVLAK